VEDGVIGDALIALADFANAVGGDFHALHLNLIGEEFDTLHGEVLKKYYEEAGNDYDSLAELARMYVVMVPNPNGSAERIGFDSWDAGQVTKPAIVGRAEDCMKGLLEMYSDMYRTVNEIEDDARTIGVANFLQTRIEYWSKECAYFNRSRA
jgi:DNA-binding ferritin-like protein